MATYTVVVEESQADCKVLQEQHYHVQASKAVKHNGGLPSYSVVFASGPVAPKVKINWQVQYGLNWTTEQPGRGASVEAAGAFQSCALGETYNLDNTGSWVLNNNHTSANPKALNIGKNGSGQHIYVIVAVRASGSGDWQPIWVSQNKVLTNASANFEPLESVKIWYQESSQTGKMISDMATESTDYDFGKDNTHERVFHYDVQNGVWKQQPNTFTPFK